MPNEHRNITYMCISCSGTITGNKYGNCAKKKTCKKCLRVEKSTVSYEVLAKTAELHGCTLLITEEDLPTKKKGLKIRFSCSCGKEGEKTYDYFLKDPICRSCAQRKGRTGASSKGDFFNQIVKKFEEKGCKLLSTEDELQEFDYHYTKLKYLCRCGRETTTTLNNFKESSHCKGCSYDNRRSFEDICAHFENLGLALLTEKREYDSNKQSLSYVCKCGEEAEVTWLVASRRTWIGCNECSRDRFRHSYDEVKSYFSKYDCVLLSGKYTSVNKRLNFLCLCGEYGSTTFKAFKRGARCRNCMPIRRAQTNMEKYGVVCVFQNEDIKQLSRETCIRKYGKPYIMQIETFVKKAQQTNLQRCGFIYRFMAEDVRKKGRETLFEKYGVYTPFESAEIQKKIDLTNLNTIGVRRPLQSKEIQEIIREKWPETVKKIKAKWPQTYEKIKRTCLERFGYEHPSQCPQIIDKIKKKWPETYEKIKATCLERYGYENPMQNPEIFEKSIKNSFRRKEFVFPSGRMVYVMGYEPFALQKLLDEGIDEDDILLGSQIPTIRYIHPLDGTHHVYHPDIYIPSKNLLIEVKSVYIYNRQVVMNEAKFEATQTEGYDLEVRFFDYKGREIEDEWTWYIASR